MSDTDPEQFPDPDKPRGVDELRHALKRERERRIDAEQQFAGVQAMIDRERQGRLEAERQRAADAEQIGDLRAELTFTQAGIDTGNSAGALFAAKYDGELSVEAVQTAYAGFLSDAMGESRQFAERLGRVQPNGHSRDDADIHQPGIPQRSVATAFNRLPQEG
jgi:hypothetical protein